MKEGWTYKKLGEVAEIQYGTRVVQNRDGGSIYPVYGGGGATFKMNSYNREDCLVVARFAMSKQCTRYVKGKFFLNDSGLTLNSFDQNILLQSYLDKCILGLNDFIYFLGKGMAQKNLDMKSFRDLPIRYPNSLSEQRCIVAELDLLSDVIGKQKAQIEELNKLAQSIFYNMFGDPVTNDKKWEKTELEKTCLYITDGDHMPPPKANCGIPFITISDIDKVHREIIFDDTFFVPIDYYNSLKEERKAKNGDVLYTVTGSYGIPVVINSDKEFCFQRHIALLRPDKEKLNTSFLCYWVLCDSVKHMADDVATGIAQKTVGLSSLRKFSIILPPLALQQEFAAKVEAIEQMKAKVRQSLKETEELFNSRMDYYFN